MDTGIWRAGANRTTRYGRDDPKADSEVRDALAEYIARAKEAGQEVPIAPLSEVAELCVEAVRDNVFWATVPMEPQSDKIRARAESQIQRTPPDYLLEPTLMAKSAKERARD